MATRIAFVFALLCMAVLPALAKKEAANEPRKPSAAEKRKLDKQRKDSLKEREQRAKKNKKANEALGKKVEAVMDAWKDKGFEGAVLVAKDGQPIFKKGYAMADREGKRANAPDTLYDIGSVTKLFTAAGVLRLEQDGKLKLSDTLGKFFAFAPSDKKGITLTQLLSHTSGLSRMYDDEIDFMSRDNTVKGLLGIKLSSEPGTQFEYSNTNYYIAGAVIEVASGGTYEDYMMKHIIEPAGMKDSAFSSSEKLDDKRTAMRYEDGKLRGDVTNWPFTWGQRGCGYLVSTVEDMQRFSDAIDYGDFLDEEARRKWFSIQKETYALGWFCEERDKRKVQYHGGASPGAWAYFCRYPDDDVMFVFFLNVSETGKRIDLDVARDLETALFG
ncbi:MAG: beta-lactamase family protein [Planctomycetes bacterium]|nr:beta-lactamase family protein [Planctomycetota bacterium]